MHPAHSGMLAALHAQALRHEADAWRRHRPPRRRRRVRSAGSAVHLRHRVGLKLIEVGLSIVDPVAAVRRTDGRRASR